MRDLETRSNVALTFWMAALSATLIWGAVSESYQFFEGMGLIAGMGCAVAATVVATAWIRPTRARL